MRDFQILLHIFILFHLQSTAQVWPIGTTIQAYVEEEKLTTVSISAKIHEYQWKDSLNEYPWGSELNTIQFQGNEGTSFIDFGIRNGTSEFSTGVSEQIAKNNYLASDSSSYTPGLGFFYWHYPEGTQTSGVELLVNPDSQFRFAEVYEPQIGINIYSRNILPINEDDYPIDITWHISKQGTIDNPAIETIDYSGYKVQLYGKYAIWNIQMEIQGSKIDLANYYLQDGLAAYLDPEVQIQLGQHYPASIGFTAHNTHKSTIEYTSIFVENEDGDRFCIADWELVEFRELPTPTYLDTPLYGWRIQNNHLTSVGGHPEDENAIRDVGYKFELEFQETDHCFLQAQTTSTKEFKAEKFKIYPNPTHDRLFLELQNEYDYHIVIKNSQSKPLYETMVSEEPLDLSEYPAGIYFIEMTNLSRDHRTIQKIIKY